MSRQNLWRPIYTVTQLAACLGRSEDTIRREIKTGRLVARKLGSRTEIVDTDVQAWLGGLEAVQAEAATTGPLPTRQQPKPARGRVERRFAIAPQATPGAGGDPMNTNPATAIAAITAARLDHDIAHDAYLAHLETCELACAGTGWCNSGQQLLDTADAAGKRWEWATEGSHRGQSYE